MSAATLQVKTVEELKDQPAGVSRGAREDRHQPRDQRALRRAGLRRASGRLCAQPLRQVADLPRGDGGIRPPRPFLPARPQAGDCRGAHDPRQDRQAAAVHLRIPAQDVGGVRRDQAARRPRRDPPGRGPAALLVPPAAQPCAADDAGGAVPRAVRPRFRPGAGRHDRGQAASAERGEHRLSGDAGVLRPPEARRTTRCSANGASRSAPTRTCARTTWAAPRRRPASSA